jgi:hypothetical protein
MSAWFARTKLRGLAVPSPGRVAWAAWGGDAGKAFSDRTVESMDRSMDEETRAEPDELKVGDFVRWNTPGGSARSRKSFVMGNDA